MTLVISGFSFKEELHFSRSMKAMLSPQVVQGAEEIVDNQTGEDIRKPKFDPAPAGIYFVADSTISNGSETLLSGFRKIYEVPVKLWEPYFVGEDFRKYLSIYLECKIAVGFAGSTLTAQHYLNSISEHLSKLRISCDDRNNGSMQYQVLMNCESNPLYEGNRFWGEDTFTRSHFEGILTAEYISKVVLHALKTSLRSAKNYKLTEQGLRSLETSFIAGVQCPKLSTYHIFIYEANRTVLNGMCEIDVHMREIQRTEIAVLGLKKEFSNAALDVQKLAFSKAEDTGKEMFAFLNAAIDQVKQRGEKSIDRPAILKLFRNGELKTIDTRK